MSLENYLENKFLKKGKQLYIKQKERTKYTNEKWRSHINLI